MPNLKDKRESALSAVRFSSLTMQRWTTAMRLDTSGESSTSPATLEKVESFAGLVDELEELILQSGSETS